VDASAQAGGASSGDDDESTFRTIDIGDKPSTKYPSNAISNAKYSPWNFLPLTLYNEFHLFINMYFLLIALSQLIPPLQIGSLWTYFAPLGFVLSVSLGKEAYDDLTRRRRDTEANNEQYTMLRLRGMRMTGYTDGHTKPVNRPRLQEMDEEESAIGGHDLDIDEIRVRARDIKVGDVLRMSKDQRVPADVVVLKCVVSESATRSDSEAIPEEGSGETFIRTDQLDGETDWKLRTASPLSQGLSLSQLVGITVVAAAPSQKVNEFVGKLQLKPGANGSDVKSAQAHQDDSVVTAPLSIDNTAWANTVLASSATVFAVVVYTGAQTRQALSTSSPRSKRGLLEQEINNLVKVLCLLTLVLSAVMTGLQYMSKTPENPWYISIFRFLILFSSMIPISVRVNLDLGKSVYAHFIHKDKDMPGAVVRTSTIPEDLGRIEYLLSDKTGTLTQNEMDLKKIHIGTVSYANEAMDEVMSYVRSGFTGDHIEGQLVTPTSLLQVGNTAGGTTRTRREIGGRVRDVVLALALCHNVTPTTEEINGETVTSYQASSPDEIAIVKWTESVGLRLVHRDRHSMALESVDSRQIVVRVRILDMFPFTSESKRMGIVLQYLESTSQADSSSGEIWFYQKGADTVMSNIVAANDWLDEETANMAREGLRTLVVGRRKLSAQQYADFASSYRQASSSLQDRDAAVARVIKHHLEQKLELLGVSGVEDKLQDEVKTALELMRNAGIKIWMLTGDKVETARCVAVSSKLVSRTQTIHTITSLHKLAASSSTAATDALGLLSTSPATTALLIDGDSLSHLLTSHRVPFISLAVRLPAVIACRCSPTQKAEIALLIRSYTGKRVACIGDGGNDVSMIQAADVGVGIVGKEGRQASLAADFSLTQFRHLSKLLVWHGRNSYKRSAKLAQFVMHRGLLLAAAQLVWSLSAAAVTSEGLVTDWLLVAYATAYTQHPVFSLVLDRDVDERLARLYPELYRDLLARGRQALSARSAAVWALVSVFQAVAIQLLSQLLVGAVSSPADVGGAGVVRPAPERRMLAVAYSALICNELLMVATTITTWHWVMAISIAGSAVLYAASVPSLAAYFDLAFVWSWGFAWRVAAIVAISIVPVYVSKVVSRTIRPPSYRKVRGV